MRKAIHVVSVVVTVAAALTVSGVASAASSGRGATAVAPVVFVQTDGLSGNEVLVYDRASDGTLALAGRFATGGLGGAAVGAVVDKLASQGSLAYDAANARLYAVNAGSDSLSVFSVDGDRLSLLDVASSGGQFPAGVAAEGNLVYVLNAGGAGSVTGFRLEGNKLHPINRSTRSLGLANSNPPFFLTSPGQVSFSPDGSKLIVTTKASGSTIDVYAVGPNGRLSDTPVANPSATPVPFGFTFDPAGRLVMTEAATSTVTTYTLNGDGTLTGAQSLSDGQAALCWIARVGGYYYGSNTGSKTVSGYRIDANGRPTLIGATGIVAVTATGPIDLVASGDGSYLYVETGGVGTVDEFRVNGDGTLTRVGTITGLPAGIEGIAAS